MTISLLPSEIARLVLYYLEDEELPKTKATFLDECKYLSEYKIYMKRGIKIPRTIHGKNIYQYLVVTQSSNDSINIKTEKTSIGIQTEIIVDTCSMATDTNDLNSASTINDQKEETILKLPITETNNSDSTSTTNPSIIFKNENYGSLSSTTNKLHTNEIIIIKHEKLDQFNEKNASLHTEDPKTSELLEEKHQTEAKAHQSLPSKSILVPLFNEKVSTPTKRKISNIHPEPESEEEHNKENMNSNQNENNNVSFGNNFDDGPIDPQEHFQEQQQQQEQQKNITELEDNDVICEGDNFATLPNRQFCSPRTPSLSKKPRILIGKKTEKLPELSMSTIDRHCASFISGIKDNITQSANNNNSSNIIDYSQFNNNSISNNNKLPTDGGIVLIPAPGQLTNMQNVLNCQIATNHQPQPQIFYDILTGQMKTMFTPQPTLQPSNNGQILILQQSNLAQQTISSPLPPISSLHQPTITEVQSNKDSINKKPVAITDSTKPKVLLTNALMSSIPNQVEQNTEKTSSSRRKAILPKDPSKASRQAKPPREGTVGGIIFKDLNEDQEMYDLLNNGNQPTSGKKKRVYNRITPTIRAIMQNDNLRINESPLNPSACDSQQQYEFENTGSEVTESRDVHDEIGDIFDFACVKSAHNYIGNQDENSNDSNDLSLEDILINNTNKRTASQNLGSNNKEDKNEDESDSSSSSEDYDLLFSESNLSAKTKNVAKQNNAEASGEKGARTTRTLRSQMQKK